MADIFLNNILMVIVTLVGGWFIYEAIRYFRERKYFFFGVEVFLTIWMILNMIQLRLIKRVGWKRRRKTDGC